MSTFLKGSADLVYCNGIFHQIPVAERMAAVDYIQCCLRPGGMFALWPWNSGTRYVMSRCTFDRNAIPIARTRRRTCRRAAVLKFCVSTSFSLPTIC